MTECVDQLLPDHLKDYGVLAVALFGVCIAWGQWTTARTKLILDLYDKRRTVYSKFHGPIGTAMRDGASDFENYVDFIKVIDEAQFLFGRGVLDYFEEMRIAINNLGEASLVLRESGNSLPQEERSRHIKKKYECMVALSEFWKHLDRLMLPYMLMEQKRPWSISRVTGYFGHKYRVTKKLIRASWRRPK